MQIANKHIFNLRFIKYRKYLFLCLLFLACEDKELPIKDAHNIPDLSTLTFSIDKGSIFYQQKVVRYKGVNAMQTFGLTDPELMSSWEVGIVREFIGNLREQPIAGAPIQASDGVWYHPLQTVVDQNRSQGIITILCPFGWVDEGGVQKLFTGLNPSAQNFYADYLAKMRDIAQHFKDQPDVWLEVWNEPYHWDNQNGYSHELWLTDMQEMVDNLRQVPAFHNIILVPGNEQGQGEQAILAQGTNLLENRFNILFDLHAYEKWLVGSSKQQVIQRFEKLKNQDFAFLIGELGVQNVGAVMPVTHFLEAADHGEIPVLGWLWNQNSQYNNALLDEQGEPNATAQNNFWGEVFRSFLKN